MERGMHVYRIIEKYGGIGKNNSMYHNYSNSNYRYLNFQYFYLRKINQMCSFKKKNTTFFFSKSKSLKSEPKLSSESFLVTNSYTPHSTPVLYITRAQNLDFSNACVSIRSTKEDQGSICTPSSVKLRLLPQTDAFIIGN